LPFVKEGETLPVYSCLGCGYVWRQPIAKHGASRDDDAGKP
jgi:hypothetical protein